MPQEKEEEVVNFIWQTRDGEESTFHNEFLINVVFKGLKCHHYFEGRRFKTVLNNSLILYTEDTRETDKDFKQYLYQFIRRRFNFSLFHLSNEYLHHNSFYYSWAKRVFRHYYDKRIETTHKNVTFLPLGFKSGFFNESFNQDTLKQDIAEKVYDFCFIGQLKSDREEIYNWICQKVPKERGFTHITRQWTCPSALTQKQCIEVYRKTKFVPCPMGNINGDTFRISESLEWGAVPIIRSYKNSPLGPDAGEGIEYHTKTWGDDSPIPVVDTWEEGLEKFRIMSDEDYKKLHDKIFRWYEVFRSEGRQVIKENIF